MKRKLQKYLILKRQESNKTATSHFAVICPLTFLLGIRLCCNIQHCVETQCIEQWTQCILGLLMITISSYMYKPTMLMVTNYLPNWFWPTIGESSKKWMKVNCFLWSLLSSWIYIVCDLWELGKVMCAHL